MGQTLSHSLTFPYVVPFTNARLYAFVACFVTADVAIPLFVHWIHPQAGPTVQPMYFLIILAGLLLGWRAGLLVGVATPLVSFVISGMPELSILPRIFIEGVCYGVIAGVMRERYNLNTFASVAVAVIVGRMVAPAVLLFIYGFDGPVLLWDAAMLGWPGIMLQVTLLPLILHLLEYILSTRSKHNGIV